MTHHAFIDESARGRKYLICAATILPTDLGTARRGLRSLRATGQRRIHFATESDQRRRSLLKEMSTLDTASVIYIADHRNQVAARAAVVASAVIHLHPPVSVDSCSRLGRAKTTKTAQSSTGSSGQTRRRQCHTSINARPTNRCCGSRMLSRGPGAVAKTGRGPRYGQRRGGSRGCLDAQNPAAHRPEKSRVYFLRLRPSAPSVSSTTAPFQPLPGLAGAGRNRPLGNCQAHA